MTIRQYQILVADALRRLPAHRSEWTDFNQSDPGVTLVQLFAWLADNLLYRSNRIPESSRDLIQKIAARARHQGRAPRLLISGGNQQALQAAARFIASRLGCALVRLDLSRVVSQYIGETEKNLRSRLDAVTDRRTILFFDEADALFGKRSGVRDSHDRYANQETAWLLSRLERYRGLVILATDRKGNVEAQRLCKLYCDLSKLRPGQRRPQRRVARSRAAVSRKSDVRNQGRLTSR
jgi:hypothetical protein